MNKSPTILAIDTATAACSVAIFIDNTLLERFVVAPKQHANLILPLIAELLAEAQISLKQLDFLAFGAGPGSFTGIRIAASVMQGLAYAADLPVVPVSTLAALAQGVYRQFNATNIVAALDARINQVYWGVYKVNQQSLVDSVLPDQLSDPDQVYLPSNNQQLWVGAGSGWQEYQTILTARLKDNIKQIYPGADPAARDIISLARREFLEGRSCSAAQVLPIYLRNKVV